MSVDWLPALASAWLLGLLGGGHCLGMCGGLMGALSLAAAPGQGRHWPLLVGYNLGRVLSYALAGLLFGGLGLAVAHTPALAVLRTLAALLLVAMGLYLAGWWYGLTRIEALGRGLWRHLQPLSRRLLPARTLSQALALGGLWGWLPCGLVYSVLLWSAAQGDAVKSAALMLAFGLGTWPVMLATGLAGQGMLAVLRRRGVRMAAGLLVLGFGLWSLPGPHQHWLMGWGHGH
ncbi:sulfite exporter TauE/SafE family protein [Pseudomonas typographi]|uniref:sulfite exporter TauE/SafE family protein n=1 Tax=Pseudomonas typographi TaxID=2715964 RepID=UPI0016874039|nr:sulfite exporter TauE/SafE family protein [Pseudomonas typographi]MBD1553454.1 sulfite exporter TauE/SafE family protein [Pseudomonas typographi]